ncbi:MAG TPA: M56 family metallopeptidase [Pirellulales bacterium]|nr:M56 family metallopeptidase [Pirellulales bacterium]
MMNDLLTIVGHNVVAALVLSVLVYALTRVWRNPPVAHVLWLVVLLRLVAPPVVRLNWHDTGTPDSAGAGGEVLAEIPQFGEPKPEQGPRFIDRPAAQANPQVSAASSTKHQVASAMRVSWKDGRPVLCWLWLGGSALCAGIAVTRIVRFERRLRDTLPGSERLRRLARTVGGRLGVRGVPDVRYVESVDVPFVWWPFVSWTGRRPTIVLPMRLAAQLDDTSLLLILAHELAHLRRRDHWVRAVELIVSTIYWWNPLV